MELLKTSSRRGPQRDPCPFYTAPCAACRAQNPSRRRRCLTAHRTPSKRRSGRRARAMGRPKVGAAASSSSSSKKPKAKPKQRGGVDFKVTQPTTRLQRPPRPPISTPSQLGPHCFKLSVVLRSTSTRSGVSCRRRRMPPTRRSSPKVG